MKSVFRSTFLIFLLHVTSPAFAIEACSSGFARLANGLASSRAEKFEFWDRALASKEIQFKIEEPVGDEGYWMYELQTKNGRHVASVEFDFESESHVSIQWQATETRYQRQGAQTVLARRIAADFPKVQRLTSSLQDTNLELMRSAVAGGATDVEAFKTTAVYRAYAEAGFGTVEKILRYERSDKSVGYIFFLSRP